MRGARKHILSFADKFGCGKGPAPSPVTSADCTSAAILISRWRCSKVEITSPQGSRTMSFFPCSKCGCVEDTALCRYWSARLQQTPTLCSACDRKIAKWHGQFPQESAQDWINDERGLLCSKSDVEHWLGQSIEIIGKSASQFNPIGMHSSGSGSPA